MAYKPPSKINILGLTYDVILRRFPEDESGLTQVGASRSLEQEIQLDPRLKDDAMAQTLWHEVIHSILDGLSQDAFVVQDETLVQGMAIALNEIAGPLT